MFQNVHPYRLPETNPELIRQVSGLNSQVQAKTIDSGNCHRIRGSLVEEMLAHRHELVLPAWQHSARQRQIRELGRMNGESDVEAVDDYKRQHSFADPKCRLFIEPCDKYQVSLEYNSRFGEKLPVQYTGHRCLKAASTRPTNSTVR